MPHRLFLPLPPPAGWDLPEHCRYRWVGPGIHHIWATTCSIFSAVSIPHWACSTWVPAPPLDLPPPPGAWAYHLPFIAWGVLPLCVGWSYLCCVLPALHLELLHLLLPTALISIPFTTIPPVLGWEDHLCDLHSAVLPGRCACLDSTAVPTCYHHAYHWEDAYLSFSMLRRCSTTYHIFYLRIVRSLWVYLGSVSPFCYLPACYRAEN